MSMFDCVSADLVDVWNSKSFGRPLCAELIANQSIVQKYYQEQRRLDTLDRDEHLTECLQGNRYFSQYEALQLRVAKALTECKIRVWHYTRLLDFETTAMTETIELSTVEKMRARLTELERRGHLSSSDVECLLQGSVLKTQKKCRENRFFCVSSPLGVTDRGVELLLGNWGGEVVYFHQKDESLLQKLRALGLPRVIEIAAEVSDPISRYSLARCVLDTYALDLGFPLYPSGIDLCIKENPPPARVLAVHTQGEEKFHEIGQTYPEGTDILLSRHERWNKLSDD